VVCKVDEVQGFTETITTGVGAEIAHFQSSVGYIAVSVSLLHASILSRVLVDDVTISTSVLCSPHKERSVLA